MTALAPCPFCGGSNVVVASIRDGRAVGCIDCRAMVEAFYPDAQKKASEKWNARAIVLPADLKAFADDLRMRMAVATIDGKGVLQVLDECTEAALADAAKGSAKS